MPTGGRLVDHLSGDNDDASKALPGPGQDHTVLLRLGPIGSIGHDVRIRRIDNRTETRDVVWLLDSADLQDWTYDRRYIEETVQEVAR